MCFNMHDCEATNEILTKSSKISTSKQYKKIIAWMIKKERAKLCV